MEYWSQCFTTGGMLNYNIVSPLLDRCTSAQPARTAEGS